MKRMISLVLVLILLVGCTPAQEVEDMAYSNVTFPTLPELNWDAYPYRMVCMVYTPGADTEDWHLAHLFVSDYPFYYDKEKGCINTYGLYLHTSISPGESWSTSLEDWGGTVEAVEGITPGLWIVADLLLEAGDKVSTPLTGIYNRIWTYHAIEDTEGNVWLPADSVTPVYTFPDNFTITPDAEIVVKQGEEHLIQCSVMQNGEALDPTHYVWRVYESKRVDGELGWYVTDAVTIDDHGLLTVTTNTTTTQRFMVIALDAVLGTQGWFLRTEALNLKSFLIGLALGLSGKPIPPILKTPIAYLYNGVRLPKLPEWDREKYPWAYMTYIADNYCHLYLSSASGYFNSPAMYANDSGSFVRIVLDMSTGVWDEPNDPVEFDADGYIIRAASALLWTNTDVLTADGAVHLAASKPIPVYE